MIWHPYSPQKNGSLPVKIKRASAEFLYDEKDNEYIDAISSWWTCIHGHNHPRIVQAITDQIKILDHVILAGFSHESVEKLSEKLNNFTDNKFFKIFYSDNGSCGVEIGLKIAYQYFINSGNTDKKEIIHFSSSYHGDTIGAMSVGGLSSFNKLFSNLFFKSKEFTSPDCYNCVWKKKPASCNADCLFELEKYLEENGKNISSIIIEPLIQGANGMIFYDRKVLQKIRSLCDKNDILLIFDEVFTGFGRTGKKFAFDFAKIIPDILVIAKGLSGGSLPIAATLVTEKVYKEFYSDDPRKTFLHGHTMTGNPSACAASLASLEIFESQNSIDKIKELEKFFQIQKNELETTFGDLLINCRTMGAVFAADIHTKKINSSFLSEYIRTKCFEKGVIIRPLGNVVYLTPPYNISKNSLYRVFEALRFAFTFLV